MQCPKPLILARKQLIEQPKLNFIIIIDNNIARNNIERYLSDNKIPFSTTQEDINYYIEVNSELKEHSVFDKDKDKDKDDVEMSGAHLKENSVLDKDKENKNKNSKKAIICIKSNKMGEGDEELGLILMKAFISTLKESAPPLPSTIIFYNSGVKLTTNTSDVFDEIRSLEELGVNIIICGTCTDYYEITNQISLGTISNMFEIIETLNNANKIIYP